MVFCFCFHKGKANFALCFHEISILRFCLVKLVIIHILLLVILWITVYDHDLGESGLFDL